MHLIYSLVTQDEENIDEYTDNTTIKIFAIALQKRIFLLLDNNGDKHQIWRLFFIQKDKKSLRKTLEKEMKNSICDSLLNHMFERIVGNQ